MSRRSEELAAALVRTQGRVRRAEKALAKFVAERRDRDPSQGRAHYHLRTKLEIVQNDVDVIQRMLRDELERPFDLLAETMVPRDG
jgi:hypothetical protein